MKIRVTTKDYEYQGLFAGSEHDVENYQLVTGLGLEPKLLYSFTANGKLWKLYCDDCEEVPNANLMDVISTYLKKEECRSSYCECEEGKCSGGKVDMRADEAEKIKARAGSEKKTPIKSDGGSSTYYELEIRNKQGQIIKAEVGDVIRAMVGNDFDFGNCVKALRRMYLSTKGCGKEGVSLEYDGNKVKYFIDEIIAQQKWS